MIKTEKNYSTVCECGKEKAELAEACVRCEWLDGRTACELEVIRLLQSGPSTLEGLVHNIDSYTDRQIRRALCRLVKTERVLVEDTDQEKSTFNPERKVYVVNQ